MSRVVIVSWARNAEKTLSRTVESILAQTYTSWIYYLIDNASEDGTFRLMQNFAELDERIIAVENGKNDMQLIAKYLPRWLDIYSGGDYFAVLDADDAYSPDFLETALRFTLENSLEICCCGSRVINADDPSDVRSRLAPEDIILEGSAFDEKFPEYYIFMRTFWAKLYSFNLLSRCNLNFPPGIVYGLDTLFAMEAFSRASRAGILSKLLHDYFVYHGSASSAANPARIASDRLLYERGERFLTEKCSGVSSRNRDHLNEVYFQAVRDTIGAVKHGGNLRLLPLAFSSPGFLKIFIGKTLQKLFK
jgi:glycosyltransferase involved in cell wall biosynthesis